MFSGGKTPYPGMHPLELYGQLELGYRMERPYNAACSEKMYACYLHGVIKADGFNSKKEAKHKIKCNACPEPAQITIIIVTHQFVRYQVMMCCWNARAELRPTFSELVLRLSYLLGSATGYFDFITITNSQAFETGTQPRQLPDNYISIYKPHVTRSEHPRPQRLQSDSYLAMASPSSASNNYISLNVSPTSSRAEIVFEECTKNVPPPSKATPPKPSLLASDSYVVMNTSNATPTQLGNNEGCDNAYVFTRI